MKNLLTRIGIIVWVLFFYGAVSAQCSFNIEATVLQNSTCVANGIVQVTLEGEEIDTSNILIRLARVEGSINEQSTKNGMRFTNLMPGNYRITATALCKGVNKQVTRITNVVVLPDYPTLKAVVASSAASIKCVPTGSASINIWDGLAPYKISIIEKPALHKGVTEFVKATAGTIKFNQLAYSNYTFKRTEYSFKWQVFNAVQNAVDALSDTLKLKNQATCDSLVVLNLKALPVLTLPATFKLRNDTIDLTPCMDFVELDVLANDDISCSNPVINILDIPFANAYVVKTNNNRLRYFPYMDIHADYFGKTDSVRYSVTCGAAVDTAWAFFRYPPALSPYIEVESRFNKSCFAIGDTIVEEMTLHYNCLTGQHLVFDSDLVSSLADFEFLGYEIVTTDNTPGHEVDVLTAYFRVKKIKDIAENAITNTSGLYIYNPYTGQYILLNENKNTDFTVCSDYDLTLKDCSQAELNFNYPNAVSYQLIQQPQLSGATATITDGKFIYFPPKVSDIKHDSVKYGVDLSNGGKVSGIIRLTILHCIDSIKMTTTQNLQCNNDSCNYSGPSILINEVIITPQEYDGAIYGYQCNPDEERGGEWIEVYNPNKCDSIDISGYFLGNSTSDSPNCSSSFIRDIGAAFVLPTGTIIPPMGFCVLRGQYAAYVDSARLIENGGNTVVINLMDYFDRFCLSNKGNRFWLPNQRGWFGFYDRNGVPQDAIYWGEMDDDICPDCHPCNPQIMGTYTGTLASLDEFPANRKTRIADTEVGKYQGNTPKRMPDGGAWGFNDFTPPTQGFCNGDCNTRADINCTGTASATTHGGSGNFSYLWDDPYHQTTPTATKLCEGIYYCTITDMVTGLKEVVSARITNLVEKYEISIDTVICAGDSVKFQNEYLKTAGVYAKTFKTAFGCDSIISLNLKVTSSNDTIFRKTICYGDSLLFSGNYLTITGTYTNTLTNAGGCDSIVTLQLRVDRTFNSVRKEICEGDVFIFNGKPLTISGTYIDTFATVDGCDSIVALRLKILPAVFQYEDYISEGQSIIINGHEYKKEGIYIDTLKNHLGCDSIMITRIIKEKDKNRCPDIEIPIYFSPNIDFINGKWKVKYIDCYSTFSVKIYDRFGKLLHHWENYFPGWDGNYLGEPMPSTDYWYLIKLNNEMDFIGHFTLLR